MSGAFPPLYIVPFCHLLTHKMHTSELPEDGQQLRPKHVLAIIDIQNLVGIKYYVYCLKGLYRDCTYTFATGYSGYRISAMGLLLLPPNLFFAATLPVLDRVCSVGVATRYWLDCAGIEYRWWRDFPHPFTPALEPTQRPIQCVFHGGKAAWLWR